MRFSKKKIWWNTGSLPWGPFGNPLPSVQSPYLVPCHPVWHQYLTIILKREIKFTDASSMSPLLPNKFLKVICKENHRGWIMYKSNGSIRQFKTNGFVYSIHSIYLPCSGSSSKKCCAVPKLIFSPKMEYCYATFFQFLTFA